MKWESSSDILSVVSGRSCFYLRVKGVLPTDAVRKNDNWRVLVAIGKILMLSPTFPPP